MKPTRKTRIAVSIAASLGLTGAAVAKPPQGMPQAKFSWSMAERTRAVENVDFKPEITSVRHFMIEGPVAGQPGLFGGVSSVPLDQINPPDGYEVSFDGCASTGDIQQYQWRVDGKRIPGNATRCTVTTRLPEGVHEVELLVKNKGRKSTVTQTVEIKDYLIVIMGDSYSSGEGNATRYDFAPSEIGNAGSFSFVTAHISRHAGPIRRTEASRHHELHAALRLPIKTLLMDVFFHRDLSFMQNSRVFVHGRLRGESVSPSERRDSEQLPVTEHIQSIGNSPPTPSTPLFPRYRELVSTVFKRAQWDQNDFVGRRVLMQYPPIPSSAIFQAELPE